MMRKTLLSLALCASTIAVACGSVTSDLSQQDGSIEASSSTSDQQMSTSTTPITERDFTYKGEIAAPEIPNGLEWFNVERPLSLLSDLRGKIVILDFCTQGCINCLHVIPDLHRLENEYPNSLVVIGVHWAKFDHERTNRAVDQAVRRLEVQHPVVNDDFEYLRRAYRVRAWPTLVLIDPLGRVVGSHAGEGIYPLFQPVIDRMSREYGTAGLIDVRPLEVIAKEEPSTPTVLSFPGKVLADQQRRQLFVADSGHHRIIVTDFEGQILDTIGGGTAGLVNGSWDNARFNQPQGMTLSSGGRYLYVADRANHAIRVVDLFQRTVETLAGTGQSTHRVTPGSPLSTSLASPWDVERVGDQIFVAGAGRHQIWVIELSSNGRTATWVDIFAGTGAEGLDDGPRLSATLSQPSGLAADSSTLWFTDPEASAVRSIELGSNGQLTTLIGEGLFSWGDTVGASEATKLQHAVGIELLGGDLYVADTYNHRIKVIDSQSTNSRVVAGNGEPGLTDGFGGAAQLDEPSGLSGADGTLFIADTNNHRIRTLDIATGELTTLKFSNQQSAALLRRTAADEIVTFPLQTVSPGTLDLTVELFVPNAYEFNSDGTFVLEIEIQNASMSRIEGRSSYQAQGPTMPQQFSLIIEEEEDLRIQADATVFYCPARNATFCLLRHVQLAVPIAVEDSGVKNISLTHELPTSEEIDLSIGVIGD
ncbi:MAG: redoxin domain-containing protein [Acidimicrobiales bacterium]|nr:redoxin domain-containing protein [Acidimicrobiales bacterium]